MNRISVIILMVLCCSFGVRGQQVMTLDSCIEIARRNNAVIKKARLDVEEARQVRNQARTKYFPQITATAMGYHALSPLMNLDANDIQNGDVREILNWLYDNFGQRLGIPNSITMFSQGVAATVNAVQPVYYGGKIVAGNMLAKVGVQAAELKEEVTERDVLMEVEESYWLVVNLEAKREAVASARQLLDTVRGIVDVAVTSGIAMPNDALEVRLKQDELAAKALRLDNGISLARQALWQSIGIEGGDCEVDMGKTMSDSILSVPMILTVDARPEAGLLDLQVKAERLKRRMELAEALPKVVVGGTYGYVNVTSPMSPSGSYQFVETDQKRYLNGVIGVTVTVPVTGWWETAHKMKQGEIAVQKAELERSDLREKMGLQMRQAYNNVTETAALVRQYESSDETARENFRLARLNYEAGLKTITELLQAQTLYLQAENNLTDARIGYLVAVRRYRSYGGE